MKVPFDVLLNIVLTLFSQPSIESGSVVGEGLGCPNAIQTATIKPTIKPVNDP